MKLFLWIGLLMMILTSCRGEEVEVPAGAQIKIIHVKEGDRTMDCAVYFDRFSCNWDAWNDR